MERSFELLRWRLLLNRLDRIESSELHALVIREAKVASEIACGTDFSWLVFPCVFEERVESALARQAREASRYWRGLGSPALGATPGAANVPLRQPAPGYVLAATARLRAESNGAASDSGRSHRAT
jgi:hypothetical protein